MNHHWFRDINWEEVIEKKLNVKEPRGTSIHLFEAPKNFEFLRSPNNGDYLYGWDHY